MLRALILGFALWLCAPMPSLAAEVATLAADAIALDGTSRLVARGNVEVFYGKIRLRASAIVFDRRSGMLTIEGPITLVDGDRAVLIASEALLSSDLRDGILRTARLVLDDRLQLAANEIARIGGRYSRMTKVTASSCRVRANGGPPLWEIRARRVTHDAETRQLYFDGAQFRVAGVPVFYLPRLRMPDPTQTRATGFLTPGLQSTSEFGTGLRLPYFIVMGPSRDLTLTPVVTTQGSATLEWRFRQAFVNGGLTLRGALSRDDLQPAEWRGFVAAEGGFDLRGGYHLGLAVEEVSDREYYSDHGNSGRDRLTSTIGLTRTRARDDVELRYSHFRSLREGDDNALLPADNLDLSYERRFARPVLGGAAGYRIELFGIARPSDADAVGRDHLRASLAADWRRNWLTGSGMVISGMAGMGADIYAMAQDPSYPATVAATRPYFGAEIRWPLARRSAGGATEVLEPVAQVIWSPDTGPENPNEDSRYPSFDEGNLFALDRFPGADRHERGLRANLGLRWNRIAADGTSLGISFGQVLRARDLDQFSGPSGLAGVRSDWLLATGLQTPWGLALANRIAFDDDLSPSREELMLSFDGRRLDLQAGYVWLSADPGEDRPDPVSDLSLGADWQINAGWAAQLRGRYDFTADRPGEAGIGLRYRNECVAVDLSLSRRYASSTTVSPSTTFDFSVELGGFGQSADNSGYRRNCRSQSAG